MASKFSNKEIAALLRNVSAVYQIQNANQFQIRAYDLAADSIEHSSTEIKSLWESDQLDEVPRVGEHLQKYLDEYFKTGKVTHFDDIFSKVPDSMFELLKIPGIGPKTAYKLAEAGVVSIGDLEHRIKSGWLVKKGFSEKILKDKILVGIKEFKRKSDRILLDDAYETAKTVIEHLKKEKSVKRVDALGSLRRMVSTVGDIDISASSKDPKKVIEHFEKTPNIDRVVESGAKTATVSLTNGMRVDLMVQPPERYGSLLQHFTGGKLHNVHLRSIAKEKGLSLSEYGIKEIDPKGKQFSEDTMMKVATEEEFYKILGMNYIAPELREDKGEIEASIKRTLPNLVKTEDIRGDLHVHSNWSDGQESIADMANRAEDLGRDYLAMTDHSYPSLKFDQRLKEIEQYNYSGKSIRVISGLEVNINADSSLQVPNEVLKKHAVILVSIHTSFRQTVAEMTNRIVAALENQSVNVLSHPTGRLLLEREGIDADWEKIFKFAGANNKFMEINSFPNRLDLTDTLVQEAKRFGVKFTIDTDSHQSAHLELMGYGISVARRGWLESKDVINTLSYKKIKDILDLKD
ncbi:PHP domain-containing protein [Patescibacteria group bacterium]|nr:PHP domain-containing protein [Patescibacteria group bacterium]